MGRVPPGGGQPLKAKKMKICTIYLVVGPASQFIGSMVCQATSAWHPTHMGF